MPDNLPTPVGLQEVGTPGWIFWVWPDSSLTDAHLVYVTATPECFQEVCEIVAERIVAPGAPQPLVLRRSRDPQTVRWMNTLPEWTGKVVTCYLRTQEEALTMAHLLDSALAGREYFGPPTLRGRPLGGRSGMVFLQSASDSGAPNTAGRPNRLASLLGE